MDYDAGKKVKGRKIHVLVDGEGLPMRVVFQSAAVQDRDGADLVEVRPEIVLLNSHDKSSAYQLHCGLLRMV